MGIGLDNNQAINALELLLTKLKSGEARLCDFSLETSDSGIERIPYYAGGEQMTVQARRPKFKVVVDIEMGYDTLESGSTGVFEPPDPNEFTIGPDGLPAVDEYAWDMNPELTEDMKAARAERERAANIKWPARRPSFAPEAMLNADQTVNEESMYARAGVERWRRRPSTVPVKAPAPKKPKQPFGSRDLDID